MTRPPSRFTTQIVLGLAFLFHCSGPCLGQAPSDALLADTLDNLALGRWTAVESAVRGLVTDADAGQDIERTRLLNPARGPGPTAGSSPGSSATR